MRLFRPVGRHELRLIAESGFRQFPPRQFWQPIFYPVLTFEYARHIAAEWNTWDERSGFAGFVTQFDVDDAYLKRFEVHEVGGRDLQELWVPAEDLSSFNRQIVNGISVVASYYGNQFQGRIDPVNNLPADIGVLAAAVG